MFLHYMSWSNPEKIVDGQENFISLHFFGTVKVIPLVNGYSSQCARYSLLLYVRRCYVMLCYVMLCNSERYRREMDGYNKLLTGKILWVRSSVTAPVSRAGLAMVQMVFGPAPTPALVDVRRMVVGFWSLVPVQLSPRWIISLLAWRY